MMLCTDKTGGSLQTTEQGGDNRTNDLISVIIMVHLVWQQKAGLIQ